MTAATTYVRVTDTELDARFGLWHVRTPLENVTGVEITGPYSTLKTIGPAHLSFTDRGVTFATNRRRGLCIRFAEPVKCMDPTGRLRHPGLTVTVVDPEGLASALSSQP
ncbi:MAG: hypothetical protein JO246_14205 [Frankiaceae bacterium]|nr:hypothetical protein [Frankiaceae bacterium]